jgi:hypothetical protein
MSKAKWGTVAIGVCGVWWAFATARVGAEGLAGLDAQLNGTGRIGTYAPQGTHIATPDAGVLSTSRDPVPAMARINAAADDGAPAASVTDGGNEVQPTDGAVAACRVEIARRRRVPPAKIAASEVVVRFTIERSGRVRDAEALTAAGTDLEVAACAKRVLSDWVFAKRAKDATVVERTYRFATARP